jgi:hypothetical protein
MDVALVEVIGMVLVPVYLMRDRWPLRPQRCRRHVGLLATGKRQARTRQASGRSEAPDSEYAY